jgi:hypothetical protein
MFLVVLPAEHKTLLKSALPQKCIPSITLLISLVVACRGHYGAISLVVAIKGRTHSRSILFATFVLYTRREPTNMMTTMSEVEYGVTLGQSSCIT